MLAHETSEEPDTSASTPKHAGPRAMPGRRRPASTRGDQTEAGREVVEALGLTPPPPAAAPAPLPTTPSPASPAPAAPAAQEPAPAPQPVRRSRDPRPPAGRSTDVEFAPRVMARRVLGISLVVLLPATVGACFLAYDDPTTLTVGVAGLLLLLLLVVYAVRVGSSPAHLAIHSGQLEVIRGNTREVFDLTSRFTRLEVVGKPGRPGWKVLMARFGRDPLVIDSSMVDPTTFTAALERHRPQPR